MQWRSSACVIFLLLLGSCVMKPQERGAEGASATANSNAEDLKQAAVLHNLGLSELARGRMSEARQALEQSLLLSTRAEPNGEQCASTNSSLGNLLRAQGDLSSAEIHLQLSVSIRRRMEPGTLVLASALNNLGNLYRVKGNFIQAQAAYEEAFGLVHRLAPQSVDEAGSLMSLGTLAQARGDQPLAGNYYERSVAIWSKVAPRSTNWARGVVNLGQVRQDQGNLKEAERLYNEVIAVPELSHSSPLLMAGVDRARAQLYEAQNRIAEAISANQEALLITLRVTPGNLAEADIAQHLGDLSRKRGDWLAAAKYYQEALDINERLVPDTADLAESLHGLGMVARHNGKNIDALNLLQRAVSALDAQSARLGGSELVNAGFRASYSQFYRDLADLLINLDRSSEAFAVVERYRARALLDQLAQRRLTVLGTPREATLALTSNAEQYESIQSQLRELSHRADPAGRDRLKAQLVDLSAARADIIASIRSHSPGFAALRFPTTLSADEAQASLDPGTVVISFLVGPSKSYAQVLGLPGEESSVKTFAIPLGELELKTKVQAFRLSIQGAGSENRRMVRRQGKELYDLLLRPAEASLGRGQRILILPDGPLYVLPFAALEREGHYLAEWKPISTTLSATLFAQLKRQRRSPDSYRTILAAFGDALYGPTQVSGPGKKLRGGDRSSSQGDLARLHSSKLEAEEIARLFPGRSQLYERAAATEENAKKLGSDVRFIHFAVHGLLDEEHPLDSALAFTTPRVARPGQDNGYLQAWELYQDAHWDADLVVLSACQSALGTDFAGEGLIGLTRAVHYAGARSVISSLWSIDDEKTEEFMTSLYAALRDGLAKDEAMQAAQLRMIRSRGAQAPYNWAAFTLQGDWM